MKQYIIRGLLWGLFMFLAMEIAYPLLRNREITNATLTAGACVWGVGGLLFGLLSFRHRTKPVEKQ